MPATNVGGVILDTTILDKLTAEIRPRTSRIVESYGLAIMSEAAQNAPVDTGALRSSLTSESGMDGDLLYIVKDGVEYGIFLELGTSKMPAQPFVVPAVESWRERFLAAFAGLFTA